MNGEVRSGLPVIEEIGVIRLAVNRTLARVNALAKAVSAAALQERIRCRGKKCRKRVRQLISWMNVMRAAG